MKTKNTDNKMNLFGLNWKPTSRFLLDLITIFVLLILLAVYHFHNSVAFPRRVGEGKEINNCAEIKLRL